MSAHTRITDTINDKLVKSLERALNRSRDSEGMRRTIEEMNRSREETRQRIGIVDVAVDLIRDARQPMKYVLDASVGLKTVLPEVDSANAIALIDNFKNQVHELIAPDTYLIECAHALTRAERKGLIRPPDGMNKFTLISDACPELHPYIPLLARAFDISSSVRLGAYDCLYIALAEREGCQVVTADKKLMLAFPSDVVSLDAL